MLISVEEIYKNQQEPDILEIMGDAPVLSHCWFSKKSLTKTDLCLRTLS
jgi:hypothetical protein